jgi:hypothetical protein
MFPATLATLGAIAIVVRIAYGYLRQVAYESGSGYSQAAGTSELFSPPLLL